MGAVLPGACFPAAYPCVPRSGRSCHPEIADRASFLFSKRKQLQLSVCGIKSEGNRRRRSKRKSPSDIPIKRDNNMKDPLASIDESSKLSGQEEILALFRRIHASISKGGPVVRKKRNTYIPEEGQTAKSVPNAQGQYPLQRKVRGKSSSQWGDQEPPQQRATVNKDETTVDNSLSESFRLSRLPSKFVKRSPVPSSTPLRENTSRVIVEGSHTEVSVETPGMQGMDGLKLSELKELARSRGIKGYSKLKKGELVVLLARSLGSS